MATLEHAEAALAERMLAERRNAGAVPFSSHSCGDTRQAEAATRAKSWLFDIAERHAAERHWTASSCGRSQRRRRGVVTDLQRASSAARTCWS